ncbi:MAG TPA: transporter [Xanthobacteraceae bacterium]
MATNVSRQGHGFCSHRLVRGALAAALVVAPQLACADEAGESFWTPGSFGSLAATPSQPGFSLNSVYYHTSTTAGSDVVRARLIRIGRLTGSVSENVSAVSVSPEDLAMVTPSYTFATPVLGAQAAAAVTAIYGRKRTTDDVVTTIPLLLGPAATTQSRFDTISDTVTGFGDLSPQFSLRWAAGVHNVMTYVTGNIPVGAYNRARLSNIGIGHGALDGGAGYTYFDERTGYEFSAVAGLTYNFVNPSTEYQSGIDVHLDWGASRFLTKRLQIGLVGYLYNQASCDRGSGDRVGCFQSRVASAGAQLGYTLPMGELEANVSVKAYREFAAANRPEGWNLWLSYTLSPAEAASGPAKAPAQRE